MFKPGESGNPNGRPVGAVSKGSALAKQLIEELIEENLPDIKKEFKELKGKDKVRALTELLPYVVPKLQATSVDFDVMQTIQSLPDDQLDILISRITKAGT